jgi:hypothetical protein
MPDQNEQIMTLASRHYAHLLRAGEGLALSPIVDLSAPAHGQVLWRRGRALEGHEVTKLDWDGLFADSRRDFERIGFSARRTSQPATGSGAPLISGRQLPLGCQRSAGRSRAGYAGPARGQNGHRGWMRGGYGT